MRFQLKYILFLSIQLIGFSVFCQKNYKVELINSNTDNDLIIYQTTFTKSKIRKDLATFYKIDTTEVILNLEKETPIPLYNMGDFIISINEEGQIIAKNRTNEDATWIDMNLTIDKNKIIQNSIFLAKEDGEGLVITLREWITKDPKKPSKNISKTLASVMIPYDDIYYHADGKLSPNEITELVEKINFSPEDRKITYEFEIYIPKELYNAVPVMIELCTKEGYQLRMIGRVDKEIMKVLRENLAPATYLIKFYNGDSKEEIKRTLIHMLPLKVDHGIDTK